jgi:L,D-peptidoglycan transpeptidase YkuD (ErfK/YbiS/YcfS/YnhG family)
MIIINKKGFLLFKKKLYRCSLGKNGLSRNKVEGDNCTPVGLYSLGKLYIRTDRIKNLKTHFKYVSIKKNMAWSDDPNSKNYNKLLYTKCEHTEKLFRKDDLYDLILVIKYNMLPTIPYKGSALFIHIAKKYYDSTKGCVALNKDDFKEILYTLKPSDKIKISDY